MAHFFLFGAKVFFVVLVGADFNGHIVHHFKSVAYEAGAFFGIVTQQLHFGNAQIAEYLRPDAVVAVVHIKAQFDVGLHGI